MSVGLVVLERNRAKVAELGEALLEDLAGDVHVTHQAWSLGTLVEEEVPRKAKPRFNVVLNGF